MAGSNQRDLTASNEDGASEAAHAEALAGFVAWQEGRPLAVRSREAYVHQVRRYLAWLGDR